MHFNPTPPSAPLPNRGGDGGGVKTPILWGIINLTPDSFYAGSRATLSEAIERAGAMFAAGAAMVDVGAESTRPGAVSVPAAAQTEILTSFLKEYQSHFGKEACRRISVDTRDLAVMQRVAEFGVGAINDVSGGSGEIYRFIAQSGVDYVLMHTKGTPETMHQAPQYDDVFAEVAAYLNERAAQLVECGVQAERIIFDSGIGFGKTAEHNLQLIARHSELRRPPYRLLAGVSRKSFIGKILGQNDPADRLIGTLATQIYLTLRGLDILRLHDVREMADALKMLAAIREYEL